jgi:hypothetical protein
VAGATVHQVTAELDHGPILAQAVVPVLPGDTADTLAARVLTQEHLIYPAIAVAEGLLGSMRESAAAHAVITTSSIEHRGRAHPQPCSPYSARYSVMGSSVSLWRTVPSTSYSMPL